MLLALTPATKARTDKHVITALCMEPPRIAFLPETSSSSLLGKELMGHQHVGFQTHCCKPTELKRLGSNMAGQCAGNCRVSGKTLSVCRAQTALIVKTDSANPFLQFLGELVQRL